MNENQESISTWAMKTFGPAGSNLDVAKRAALEMAELIEALEADDHGLNAAEECADVVIILYRLMDRLGCDMRNEINRKMKINRKREWVTSKDGIGQYVSRHTEKGTIIPRVVGAYSEVF